MWCELTDVERPAVIDLLAQSGTDLRVVHGRLHGQEITGALGGSFQANEAGDHIVATGEISGMGVMKCSFAKELKTLESLYRVWIVHLVSVVVTDDTLVISTGGCGSKSESKRKNSDINLHFLGD